MATELNPGNSAVFWGHGRDNSLMQVLDEGTVRDAQAHLLVTKEKDLAGEMVINGSFGCTDHETEEFRIPSEGKTSSRLQTTYPGFLREQDSAYSRN